MGVSTAEVSDSSSSGADRRWLAAAAMVVVGFIGWSAWSDSSADDDLGPNAAEDARATSTPSATTTVPTSIISEGQPPAEADEVKVRQVGSGGPLLGEETGLKVVFVQQPDELSVLDLDTGRLQSVHTTFAWIEPLMMSGDWLVARMDGSLAALAVGDLDGDPIRLAPDDLGGSFGSNLVFPEPRTDAKAWVVIYGDGSSRFVQVDLATGGVVDEFAYPSGVHQNNWVRHDLDDGQRVLSSTDGGVYESVDDGYQRVTEGRLIASDDERALVEACDEWLSCERRWFDRATWTPIELPLPTIPFTDAVFVGGTDWLQFIDLGGLGNTREVQALFNVVTGKQMLLDSADHLNFEQQSPPMSPDGRWLALYDEGNLVIIDLVTNERYVIDDAAALVGGVVLTTANVGFS